jgi:uncharacterized protein VirK/YbjX
MCGEREDKKRERGEREREPRIDGSLKGFVLRSSMPHSQTARFSPFLTYSPFAARVFFFTSPDTCVSPSTPISWGC